MSLLRNLQREKTLEQASLRKGLGCPHCLNTGYRGRIGVFELLEINNPMSSALRENNVQGFNIAAHAHPHYRPLSASALDYALQGVTTFDEVLRVSAQVEDESLADIAEENRGADVV